MKIAYVLPAVSAGGAERMTIHLANTLAHRGHDVTLIVGFPSPWEGGRSAAIDAAVTVEHVERQPKPALARYLAAVQWTWRQRRRLYDFDVLHCHLTYGAIIGTLVGLFRRIDGRRRPLIVETYHAVGMRIPPLTQWLHSKMIAQRDVLALMAVDPFWTRFATQHPRLMTRTILNGAFAPDPGQVPAAARQAYRRRVGVPDRSRLVVGTIGMLRPDRQPEIFLPVVARLVSAFGAEVHWLYAGDGPERARLEALIAEAGLTDHVHITGMVTDVTEPLAVIDLYLTLLVGPVCGIAAMEAALAGVPVIGVQLLPEYQPQDDAWIWASQSTEAVAATAVALLRDAGERQRLADRQRQYAEEHHSIDTMARAYEALYEEGLMRQPAASHSNAAS